MAASLQIILRKKPNKTGECPLAIRITKYRRSTYKYIGLRIRKEFWDDNKKRVKKTHPDSKKLNKFIKARIREAKKGMVALQTKDKDASVHYMKKEIYRAKRKLSFFEFAQEHLDEAELAGKHGRFIAESAYTTYILKFSKTKGLTFNDIDERFLKRFKIYLRKKHSLKEVSVMNVLVYIRLLYNKAIREGIVKRKHYPFGAGKVKIKFPESEKIGLTREEILTIEGLTDLTELEIHARNVWLYCFYFAGIRVSDALRTRWSDIRDGRLYYRMSKNSKLLSLKIPEKVYPVLDYYKREQRDANDYIFPEMKGVDLTDSKKVYNRLRNGNSKLNIRLKSIAEKAKIDKKITMHIARHSFGNIAGDNIHPLMLQKLYRHSDLKTTINYQSSFIHKEADDALDKVINF
ncbi:site-specific integrase [Flagellimonas zhangzhouensis]|uniref:Site-specific recombinase XerD n=1 Tax=Flagellimonas zhangzhouensis TaxID=1073328 RepID=A0A1H2WR84_9FLAO|nr:site-specific integrase [Allomuricauda zhangzhouensis]SDQ24000.1 Site-specific recombinase XerD [Allomuricauda zhangzhouensis]SDW83163.1 Site-specific recombinase XerD [Allomuricauda zhangzhouensis]